MSIAESFAASFTPEFFTNQFLEGHELPQVEFVVVDMPEDMPQEKSWVESAAENLIHIPKVDLDIWQGVDMEGAPAFQEWWVCVNNRGVEEPRWDIDKCTEDKKRNMYNVTCTNVFNETALEFIPTCEYCVARHDGEALCTTPCENTTMYLDSFNDEVFDLRCIDPFYAILLENRYEPTAPPALRIVFQIIAAFFELHVVTIAIAPWYLLMLAYMLVDFLLDWLWYGIFFAWCLPCAWVFIWIFNIAFLPISVWGFIERFQLEFVGFVFDFWLLFFNGDGCFLRWGNNCWMARRIPERDHMTYTDITALYGTGSGALDAFFHGENVQDFIKTELTKWTNTQFTTPTQDSFLSGDIFAVGREKRAYLAETCPGMPQTMEFMSTQMEAVTDAVKNFISHHDF